MESGPFHQSCAALEVSPLTTAEDEDVATGGPQRVLLWSNPPMRTGARSNLLGQGRHVRRLSVVVYIL